MIGVDHKDVADKINRLIPAYMTMGDKGMADMGMMEMPLPENYPSMMTGDTVWWSRNGRHVQRSEST